MENNKEQLIEYRLTSIEEKLDEMKNLLIESQIHARDIDYLKRKVKELESNQNTQEERMRKVEEAPAIHKAERWQQVLDFVFKSMMTAAVTILLVTVGIK